MIPTAAHADLSVRAATLFLAKPPRQPLADPTTMASAASQSSKYIQLALALPQRLRTFLARYPPPQIFPDGQEPKKTAYQEECPNPFLPYKHPVTGKWHNPKYSLRRQAELVKMAREHGVEELLPYTPKGTEARLRKRIELGLRVKGTGVGQRVKGHKHERQLMAKMEERRQAMLAMPELIKEWKKVGKRDWTKYPK
ncbi:mitochondrial 54S ribosomal protein mL59 [Thermochaetoides thermophila DSM 1495]|uniref:Putative ribosomal protein n=1 Tax=Chaetomium thermophilum (strain DSM 1495 / CBS 144.50 / IMI 039719) TaxID=759272 RepID=G0SBQ6_CHATD|nr:putative ribosomal protein [Thermochaetoides thermophila DSM 1495]EGS18832.1 putative ribosomal protein [Thermochaetoides thermophila DSM 1495]